jgi:hypothetical protein
MDATVADVIRRVWSTAWGSFEALQWIRLKMIPSVDTRKVAEFIALVDPSAARKPAQQFPPSIKKGMNMYSGKIDVPDGIIAHLRRECGGNVHDRHIVGVL